MKDILFIDGYNIIHAWHELSQLSESVNLEAARQRLTDMIGEYAVSQGIESVIVFDAHMVKGIMNREEQHPGVRVVYTAEHQTADAYIERRVAGMDRYARNIYVATSDAMEQIVVSSQGAARVSARELLRDIKKSKETRRKTYGRQLGSDVGSRLDPEIIRRLRCAFHDEDHE